MEKKIKDNSLIAVIRISGQVKLKPDIKRSLYRLRLRRKYSCILINSSNKSLFGIVKKVKFNVAYGEIEKDTLVKLIKHRGKKLDKKSFDAEEVAEKLMKGEKLINLGFKPFFRLHPPRKGIKSKLSYPKGVLGYNGKDINKLIERML